MKKFLITILASLVGTMGYAVVDKTIENRVETLEIIVEEQQSAIQALQFDFDKLEIGYSLPCSHKSGDMFWASQSYYVSPDLDFNENIETKIDEFSCKLKELTRNGYPIFEIKIKGHLINQTYTGRITAFLEIDENSCYADGTVKDDGTYEIIIKSDVHGYRTILKPCTITLTALTIRDNF